MDAAATTAPPPESALAERWLFHAPSPFSRHVSCHHASKRPFVRQTGERPREGVKKNPLPVYEEGVHPRKHSPLIFQINLPDLAPCSHSEPLRRSRELVAEASQGRSLRLSG